MKIGILGWGSLHYDKRELKIVDDKWYLDGPVLPIEFARISSKSKKLTLVISPAFDEVRSYYAISTLNDLEAAITNLAEREETGVNNIGHINFKTGVIKTKKMETELKKSLAIWNMQHNLDALIWTDLNENFKASINTPFSLEASLKYLEDLPKDEFERAASYILKAPLQTTTKHRPALTDFIKKRKLS
jgi:hypothetical protein